MSNNLQLDSGSGGEVFYKQTAVCQMLSISRATDSRSIWIGGA
jgi:hypothetical protein